MARTRCTSMSSSRISRGVRHSSPPCPVESGEYNRHMPNGLKTALLLGALSGLLLVVGDLLGGSGGLMIALIFAAVMNIGSYWFSDKIVLRMYGAQPVGP